MTALVRRTTGAVCAVAMVLGLAACGGGGGSDKPYVEPKGPSTETIEISAKNFSFTPDDPTAAPGIATIELKATQGIHDLKFDGSYPGFFLEAEGGGPARSKKIDLKPGKYDFYCSITGHRAAGMEGTLTVK